MRKGTIWVWAFICGISLCTDVQFSTAESFTAIETGGTLERARLANLVQDAGTLSIEAGVVFRSGDVKPVARTEFILSNKSFASFLREYQISKGQDSTASDQVYLMMFAMDLGALNDGGLTEKGRTQFAEKVEGLKKCVLASAVSDFSGKATFSPLAPGTYYLIGWTKMGRVSVVWDVKAELKPGPNTIAGPK